MNDQNYLDSSKNYVVYNVWMFFDYNSDRREYLNSSAIP
jgi:hypothetical protein